MQSSIRINESPMYEFTVLPTVIFLKLKLTFTDQKL